MNTFSQEGFFGDLLGEKFLKRFGRQLKTLHFKTSEFNDVTTEPTIDFVAKYCPNLERLKLLSYIATKSSCDLVPRFASRLFDLTQLSISLPRMYFTHLSVSPHLPTSSDSDRSQLFGPLP
jgi:hypothetical protein